MESLIDYFVRTYTERYGDVSKTAIKALQTFSEFVRDELRDNAVASMSPGRIIFADGSEVTLGDAAEMPVDRAAIDVFGATRSTRRQEMQVDRTPAIQLFGE